MREDVTPSWRDQSLEEALALPAATQETVPESRAFDRAAGIPSSAAISHVARLCKHRACSLRMRKRSHLLALLFTMLYQRTLTPSPTGDGRVRSPAFDNYDVTVSPFIPSL